MNRSDAGDTNEIVIAGHDYSGLLPREAEMSLVVFSPQPRLIGCCYVDTGSSKSNGDCEIDVFVEMKRIRSANGKGFQLFSEK